MIEIKIPKEIKDYKSKLFFNLSVRQFICTAAALAICVPIYFFGKKYMDEDLISWVVILIGAPLLFTGFFSYNEMNFEQLAREWFAFNFNNQKRKYEYEPIFMELRKGYLAEDLEEEKLSKKKSKKHKKALSDTDNGGSIDVR